MMQVQRENADSFGILLNRNRNVVVQYLARMVQNRAIAEELAQDVFIRVYRSRLKYEPTAKFSTWLYRITTNVALNYFRDEKQRQNQISLDFEGGKRLRREAPDHSVMVDERLLREAVASQIRRAVRGLPSKQGAA